MALTGLAIGNAVAAALQAQAQIKKNNAQSTTTQSTTTQSTPTTTKTTTPTTSTTVTPTTQTTSTATKAVSVPTSTTGNVNINASGNGTISTNTYQQYAAAAAQAAQNWHNAKTTAEKNYWHQQAVSANAVLGKSYNAATGTWYGGYTVTQPTFAESGMQSYLDSMYENAATLRNATIEQGKQSLEQQIPQIEQDYEDAARQAYIVYMNAKKDLPAQLAAAGIGGQGVAESTLSQQNNTYQNTLTSSAQARQSYLQQVQNSIANLVASGNTKYAEDAANIDQLALQAYQSYLSNQQAQSNADRNFALQQAGLTGTYQGSTTLDGLSTKATVQAQADTSYSRKLSDTLQLWSSLGKANAQVVAAMQELGYQIPLGALQSEESYRQAKLALDAAKLVQ